MGSNFFTGRIQRFFSSLGLGRMVLAICCCAIAFPVLAGEHVLDKNRARLEKVFDLKSLPHFTLSVSVDQWNKLLSDFDQNPKNEEKVKGSLEFEKNGLKTQYPAIGFRIRGNLSRKRPEGKKGESHSAKAPDWRQAHFKLDFNEYDSNGNFFGMKALNLKFFNNDPTYVREIYSYHLFRKFGVWTAPYSSYVRLSVKVEGDPEPAYFGVYQMVESIDSRYVKARFSKESRSGDLWKCLYTKNGPANLVNDIDMNSDKIGVEDIQLDEDKSFRPSYDLKTNKKREAEAKKRFLHFLEQLNTLEGQAFEDWLEKTVDLDLFLRFLAVNSLVGMWDDYWFNANNYYLYFDPSGRCFFVPYDYDNSLGTALRGINPGTRNVFDWGYTDFSRPLVYKTLRIPKHRNRYAALLRELLDEDGDLFSVEASVRRIKSWHELIQPHVSNDTGDNMQIQDLPASWGVPGYRLFTGNDLGLGPEADYFKTRIRFAREQLER